ncbi:MAG: lysine-2,3-aminomutase-like protein, partial [Proteobacteria bacterium]|nr:lysine-2,3-aminomutase-like protein [Pseudomonadota bacterium]
PAMRAQIAHQDDAIARQFLPRLEELDSQPHESADPIGDHPHSPLPGLVHRYPDRVLIKLTHTCPVYCRFCFRREMVGPKGNGNLSEAQLDAIFAYLAAHQEIFEVIFTGGDPLMLSARRIAALGQRLAALSHIKLVRWHSRVPVVAPERITPALVKALRFAGKANYVSVHANHAREFSTEAAEALARLADGGIALLGQSVLLKGVNDTVDTLKGLFRTMAAHRITPAYLHHPDLAPGTGHFRLSIADGQALHGALRGQLSGHAIPDYVLDLPGGHGKVSIGSSNLVETDNGYRLRDRKDQWHDYKD